MFTLDQTGARWLPAHLPYLLGIIAVAHVIGIMCEAAVRGDDTPMLRGVRGVARSFGLQLRSDRIWGWYVQCGLYPWNAALLTITWLLILGLFSTGHVKPFIYFQF